MLVALGPDRRCGTRERGERSSHQRDDHGTPTGHLEHRCHQPAEEPCGAATDERNDRAIRHASVGSRGIPAANVGGCANRAGHRAVAAPAGARAARSTSATSSSRAAAWPSVWHPDIAPPGKQFEHERHLKAINEAADQLERLAEGSRGGRVSRNAVKVSAAAARAARAEAGRRAYEEEQRAARTAADRAKHDPFGARVPDHSVVHRYARCLSYPEWGVGSVTGIYFTGDGDDVQQWARVKFQVGVRTVPAGSLQFVDFSKPDPGHERVQRFMTAAQHAMAEGDYAARRPAPDLRARRRARQPRRCCG